MRKTERKHQRLVGPVQTNENQTHETSNTPVTGLMVPNTQVYTSVKTKADVQFSIQEAKICNGGRRRKVSSISSIASNERKERRAAYVSLQSISLSDGRMRSKLSVEDLVLSGEFEVGLCENERKKRSVASKSRNDECKGDDEPTSSLTNSSKTLSLGF